MTLSRRVALLIPLAVAFANPAFAADDPMTAYRKLTSVDLPCNRDPKDDEIVVCARRDADRYRLPLPSLRDPATKAAAIRGEVPRATTQLVVIGECGMFAGQRKCNKFESRGSPMGDGKDPATLLLRLGQAFINPDAIPDQQSVLPNPVRR